MASSPMGGKFGPMWKTPLGGKLTPPVVANDKILVSSVARHVVYAIDRRTGKIAWSYRRLREGALVIAGGKLIAIGGNGALALAEASPKGFDPLTTVKPIAPTCWTAPVPAMPTW